MTGYYTRLALRSFRRNPGATVVMVCAIALGIGVCVVTMTVYHAVSGNPIWWKNDRLYAVTLDAGNVDTPSRPGRPELPATQLSYPDAVRLFASDIPERKVIMYRQRAVIAGGTQVSKPLPITTRETTGDFFSMFDVPFLYGSGWDARADSRPEPVIVLSRELNDELFGGENSVGRKVRWNDHEFRIVGVLDAWFPKPKFYDLNSGAYDPPEDAFIPFAWGPLLKQRPSGSVSCFGNDRQLSSFDQFLHSECLWVQMWVELPDGTSRARMQAMIDAYYAEQRAHGRFLRRGSNRLATVSQWLTENGIVQSDDRVMVVAAFAFLAVCLANTIGILLARFLARAPHTGVRRALGATRRDVMLQHLLEVGAICLCGAALGLALGAGGLRVLHALYSLPGVRSGYAELMRFDSISIAWAVALAMGSSLAAGLYPSWRAGRLPPAAYLKSQ